LTLLGYGAGVSTWGNRNSMQGRPGGGHVPHALGGPSGAGAGAPTWAAQGNEKKAPKSRVPQRIAEQDQPLISQGLAHMRGPKVPSPDRPQRARYARPTWPCAFCRWHRDFWNDGQLPQRKRADPGPHCPCTFAIRSLFEGKGTPWAIYPITPLASPSPRWRSSWGCPPTSL
jgi:hypothetical protein